MSLYALGDLHLSFQANKPMDSFGKVWKNHEKKIEKLTESLADAKQNIVAKDREMKSKISKAVKIAESYRSIANDTLSKYIDTKAKGIGVPSSEIRRRLSESFTVADVDSVCEKLRCDALSINELPFEMKRPTKVRISESNEPIVPKLGLDDSINEQLVQLAGKFI